MVTRAERRRVRMPIRRNNLNDPESWENVGSEDTMKHIEPVFQWCAECAPLSN